jgi:DNA-binding response OmpR family regulator
MRLLLAASDNNESASLAEFLRDSGFEVDVERDRELSIQRAHSTNYQLIILVAAHGAYAPNLVRQIRECSKTPILLLTASQDWRDRVLGLSYGADDCLSAPFRREEVRARVAAVLRRTHAAGAPPSIQSGDLRLSPSTREGYFRNRPLGLTAMEYDILEMLVLQCGRVVSRDHICQHLYGRPASPLYRSVDTHVSRIRGKVRDGGTLIIGVRGSGYQFCHPPVPGDIEDTPLETTDHIRSFRNTS